MKIKVRCQDCSGELSYVVNKVDHETVVLSVFPCESCMEQQHEHGERVGRINTYKDFVESLKKDKA